MKNILERLSLLIIPGAFIGFAIYFFKLGAPVAGGVCVFIALLTVRV